MPDNDPWEDLFQTGENSYTSPWDSEDFTRSLFGLSQRPRALTSQEEITVTAPRPKLGDPYPKNLDEIYLGSQTAPPTGTYTPPMGDKPVVDPALQKFWGKFIQQYPHSEKLVENVKLAKLPPGYGATHSGDTIKVSPTELEHGGDPEQTFAHELTHAAQFKQYPDYGRNRQAYLGGKWKYDDRPGEDLAYEVGNQAWQKIRDREYEKLKLEYQKRHPEWKPDWSGWYQKPKKRK